MTLKSELVLRLQFLARIVHKEIVHLNTTNQRLFDDSFTLEKVAHLEGDLDLAERVEAFVGRFGRLQDTVGDKLLPLLLNVLGEKTSSVIDNLDRAERLGLLHSANDWMTIRGLRNQMVHEYVEDPQILFNALQTGHTFVLSLVSAAHNMLSELERRGWENL